MKPTTLHQWTALAATLVITTFTASATTWTVTNNSDGPAPAPAGSLRAAVASAKAGDTINFSSSLFGKAVKLSAGQLVLANSITINGLGPCALSVSGNYNSRAFYVSPGVAATISNITISQGNGTGADSYGNAANGGAILNYGTLTLSLDTITSDKATGSGGGIYNASGAVLTITDSTVSNNTSNLGPSSAPQSNGGGLADQGTTTLNRCTFSNNRSFANGGALLENGTLMIINSTFAYNKASNAGGAIADAGGATISVYDSTFSLNSATTGGGIASQFPVPNSWSLANTIVANNSVAGTGCVGSDINDSFGVVISLGYNLIGSTKGTVAGNFVKTDLLNILPVLGPLENNNGPTFTFAELPGSKSINAGSTALIPSGVTTDQRGYARINQGKVDIGAFEFYSPKYLHPCALAICNADIGYCGDDWEANWDFSTASYLIQAALTDQVWIVSDDCHLSNWGELTFEWTGYAAGCLEDVIQEGSAFANDAQTALDNIAMADNILAITAINDATTTNPSSPYLQNAQSALVQAQSYLGLNDYIDAINAFQQAWINAYRAQGNVCGYDDGSDQPLRLQWGY